MEVLVSMGIIVAMLSVVLPSQTTYTGRAALNNAADNIYLSIREAQVYGVGVKEFTPGSVEFAVSYGVSFNTTSSGSRDAYISFADRGVLNQKYDSGWSCPIGGSSECISKTTLNGVITIGDICYIRNNGTESCVVNGVDITFKRPDTKAVIQFFNSAGNPMPVPNLKGAKIELIAPDGQIRTILVYTTGQISVQ